MRASILEVGEKVGREGVLAADKGRDPDPGVKAGEATGVVGTW